MATSLRDLTATAPVLAELGGRIARRRLSRALSQAALAERAGVSLRTIARIEDGESVQLANWVAVLRALDLLDALDAIGQADGPSPLELVAAAAKTGPARRAPRTKPAAGDWRWGDQT